MDAIPSPLPEINLNAMVFDVGHYTMHAVDDPGDPQFDLSAPYQRESVWDLERRQNLIRSLIMGIPVGAVIVAKLPYQKGRAYHRIIDGKQRIETVMMFARGEFAVPGWWWNARDLAGGEAARSADIAYGDLSQPGRFRLERCKMPTLEYDSDRYWTENPDYDRSAERNDKTNPLGFWRYRGDDEALQAEADLYLLVNFGGVEQTEGDRARATALGSGS